MPKSSSSLQLPPTRLKNTPKNTLQIPPGEASAGNDKTWPRGLNGAADGGTSLRQINNNELIYG